MDIEVTLARQHTKKQLHVLFARSYRVLVHLGSRNAYAVSQVRVVAPLPVPVLSFAQRLCDKRGTNEAASMAFPVFLSTAFSPGQSAVRLRRC